MPTALRSARVNEAAPARPPSDGRSPEVERRGRVHVVTVIGFLAVASSALYLVSDVMEAVQGRFSTAQLWLTLVAEASVPLFVIGLWLAQQPRIGRVGAVSSIAYAYSFVFFTGTVVYAPGSGTRDFEQLSMALSPWMTIHGAVMLIAGLPSGTRWIGPGSSPGGRGWPSRPG